MAYGDKPLSLQSLKIAALNADGSYGTAVEFPQGRKLTIKPNVVSSKLVGRQARTAAVATFVADAEVSIEGGGLAWDVLAIVLGQSVTESGTTPSQTKKMTVDVKSNLPYFGIIGVAGDDDGGDSHFGLPKVKLTELPEWVLDGEKNEFLVSDMTGVAIADDSDHLIYPVSHETAAAADFTTIFS